jgi:hypothetical protein
MEDWQLEDLVSPDGRAGGLVVHEALQQSISRYALPLRFLPDSRFGLWRDVEAHANRSLLGITSYHTPFSELCYGEPQRKAKGAYLCATGSHYGAPPTVHGLMTGTPAAINGASSRVATLNRRTAAIAAIWASATLMG